MIEGLLHFMFVYRFTAGDDNQCRTMDVYAKNAGDARDQFRVYMVNSPDYKILNVELLEACE